ncbi:unnamed protein product [Brachionus calyciflorus]|uniref:Uncharacterized protein n=1 Tax=Brachionus calyciflorus TaxID=104777 RepID=A0A813MFG2_9BILA|nr:unnamed protein product [Brachionus calyciflorus]
MSSNAENVENMKSFVKEAITASTYFGITCEEYVLKFEDTYKDVFAEHAFRLESILKEKFPHLTPEERTRLFEIFFTSFADTVKTEGDCLMELLKVKIFRIPRHYVLPENKELQNAIDTYSKEEDDETVKQLEFVHKSLVEKRAYIKSLKERIAMFDLCSSMLD